jgi:hypothetical protein
MHRVIADRLRAGDSSPIAIARANLARWRTQFGGALPAAYEEWITLLDDGIDGVIQVLEGSTEEAIRQRSNSPFAGVLSPSERWEILASAA